MMAESDTRRRWKTELILRYEAEPPAEDNADNNTEAPLDEDPADAEEEVPSAAQAEVPPDEHAATTEPEDPADAEEEVPASAQAEVPPDEHAATAEPEDPAVAVQVGVPVTASDAEGPPDGPPGAVRVEKLPAAKEDEAPVTKAVAGVAPEEVPNTAEDWLTTTYWGTLVPVDILPTLRLFGGAVTGISGDIGAGFFLFGTSYAWVFPVIADILTHHEGNLRLLASSYGEGWLLNDSRPIFKCGIILQGQDTFKKTDNTWRGGFVKTTKRITNTLGKAMAYTAPECGGPSLNYTHSCVNHNQSAGRTQVSTKTRREDSSQVKHKLTLDLATY